MSHRPADLFLARWEEATVAERSEWVVGVSLGSRRRDFDLRLEAEGRRWRLLRVGTDGDLEAAEQLISRLDGRVAAIGLGGINLAYRLPGRSYAAPEAWRLARRARRTPLADGSLWKAAVEPEAVRLLGEAGLEPGEAFLASYLDRPELGEALVRAGWRVRVGDAALALGLPWAPGPAAFRRVARWTLPWLRRLPIRRLYPLGAAQEVAGRSRRGPLARSRLLAGDFHFLYRHLPLRLEGRWMLTSTVRPGELDELRRRGLEGVLLLGPGWRGLAPGANLLEALARACGVRTDPDALRGFARRNGLLPTFALRPAGPPR
ncbi:MAG: quinate 5-dehydrogenase [Bacillota bacterium]|nr:quinate 5-dehydrogenase [Bacillota bacterium]